MTKNNYLKTAIRARMKTTGEPYSVAAKAVENMPVPTGFYLDRKLQEGGLKRGSSTLISNELADDSRFLQDLALNLMEPNRRLLFVTAYSAEELTARLTARGESKNSKQRSETSLQRHLEKNLRLLQLTSDSSEFTSDSSVLDSSVDPSRLVGAGSSAVDAIFTELTEQSPQSAFGAVLLDLDYLSTVAGVTGFHAEELQVRLKELCLLKNIPLVFYTSHHGPASKMLMEYSELQHCVRLYSDVIVYVKPRNKIDGEMVYRFGILKNRFGYVEADQALQHL